MEHDAKLTSSELAVLWNAYMQNTMARCMIRHMHAVNEDEALNPLLDKAEKNITFVVEGVEDILRAEQAPIPDGFDDTDVHLSAPRLYSDVFTLRYVKYMSAIGTANAAVSLELSARSDLRELFTKLTARLAAQFNDAADLLLQKGIFIRAPIIPIPEKVEYIQQESFMSGLLGRHRPVTAIELSNVSKCLETNSIGRTFILGFSQVAESPEARNYMVRGGEIAKKHEDIFRDVLVKDDLPLPSTWDSTITESRTAPFSDKLMMFHVSVLNATSVSNYGASIAGSFRKDLGAMYSRLMTEVLDYASDGMKLMIEQAWLEQPPQAPDRVALRS